MAKYTKGVAFFLFVAIAFSCAKGDAGSGGSGADGSSGGSGGGSGGDDPQSVMSKLSVPKITKGPPVPVNVERSAMVASPIQYKTNDYNGPYDPFDPDGTSAASHRVLKMNAQKTGENIRSYVPPGLGAMAKKELIKIALAEGNRFALRHPKETNELMGLLIKAKQLLDNAKANVKKQENAMNSGSSSGSGSGSSSGAGSGSLKVEGVVKVKKVEGSSSSSSSNDSAGKSGQ